MTVQKIQYKIEYKNRKRFLKRLQPNRFFQVITSTTVQIRKFLKTAWISYCGVRFRVAFELWEFDLSCGNTLHTKKWNLEHCRLMNTTVSIAQET